MENDIDSENEDDAIVVRKIMETTGKNLIGNGIWIKT